MPGGGENAGESLRRLTENRIPRTRTAKTEAQYETREVSS
jgi:hypothetical protein